MFNDVIPLNVGVSTYMPSTFFPGLEDYPLNNEIDDLQAFHIGLEFDHYQQTLLSNDKHKQWFRDRGIPITDELIKRFKIGFADNSFGKKVTREHGRKAEFFRGNMQRSGLYKDTGRPFFHGDVVFPFFNDEEKLVGAYGRRVTPENRASRLYHRQWDIGDTLFFNQRILKSSKQVIYCKTPVEALNLICAGFDNVIATMGVYNFSEKHFQKLVESDMTEVVLAFDNSDQGNHVCGVIAQCLNAEGIFCSRLPLPKNHDVNQYAQRYGDKKSSLSELVKSKFPFSQSYENLIGR
ncbi:MAG: toprim domain-containing protein [Agarilytica sp.]